MGGKEMKAIMNECFEESVPSAVKADIVENIPFRVIENGKTYYVCMLLNVAQIGGINKKSKDDPHIGGMIQGIKGERIDIYLTKEMIDNGELLFIPTPRTFDGLADYSTFTNCNGYEFVKLNNNLEIVERTGVMASYNQFRSICVGEASIEDFVKPSAPEKPEPVMQTPAETVTAAISETPVVPETTAEPDDGDDDGELVNISGDNISGGFFAQAADKVKAAASAVAEKTLAIAQTAAEKVAESSGYSDMVVNNTENAAPAEARQEQTVETKSDVVEAEEEETEDIVYTELQVEASISRTFHADNLDLVVSSEPFDQMFTLDKLLVKFEIDDRDTYVNEHLGAMIADANRDLQKLKFDNLNELRKEYFDLMACRVIAIQKELDINNMDTAFGSKKFALENTKKDRLANANATIEERRRRVEAEYEKRRDEYCDAIIKSARSEFDAKFQRAHNDDLLKIDNSVKNDILSDYDRDLQALLIARRNEALTLLDLNITAVLQKLAEKYTKMHEAENAYYMERAEEIRDYSKVLHAEDARKLVVEEERVRISNEVNDARAEAAAKIDLIKKEYESAQNALELRAKAATERADSQCAMLKEQLNTRTEALERDKEVLRGQLDDAIEKITQVQDTVRAEYEHRLEQANDDRDSWKQTFESYEAQHKHSNRLASILVVAIIIAALAGGFILGGLYWNKVMSGELLDNFTSGTESRMMSDTNTTYTVVDVSHSSVSAVDYTNFL